MVPLLPNPKNPGGVFASRCGPQGRKQVTTECRSAVTAVIVRARGRRHHASQSSHTDFPSHPEPQSRLPHPPSCERILTQGQDQQSSQTQPPNRSPCEPILTQRPPGTTKPTKPPRQTAIMRTNPHTTPHPPVHGAQSPCQHPNHRRFGYRRTALDFQTRCGMLGITQHTRTATI